MPSFTRNQFVAACAVALLAIAGIAVLVVRSGGLGSSGGSEITITDPSGDSRQGEPQSRPRVLQSPPRPSSDRIVVYVVGCVRRPGLYWIPAGSRVMGAVESAGGALQDADLVSINMAAKLSDGQQVYIAQKGIIRPPDKSGVLSGSSMGGSAAMALGTPRPSDRSSAAGIVDINTASPEELMALPGIGPATARHIVDYRSANGGFRSVEELYEVEGLGPSKVDRIRNLVSL